MGDLVVVADGWNPCFVGCAQPRFVVRLGWPHPTSRRPVARRRHGPASAAPAHAPARERPQPCATTTYPRSARMPPARGARPSHRPAPAAGPGPGGQSKAIFPAADAAPRPVRSPSRAAARSPLSPRPARPARPSYRPGPAAPPLTDQGRPGSYQPETA